MTELIEVSPEQFILEMSKQPKTYTQQEFLEAYEKLVREMGWKIVANPVFTPTNHGSFELVVQLILAEVKL